MWPLAAILALPLIEIALFVTVGGAIGLGATMLVILGTALAGVWLLRRQGVVLQEALRVPRPGDPLRPLADGALVSMAAGLLILPGFLTDTLGALLLVPPVRRALIARLGRRIEVRAASWPPGRPDGGQTIDGDYVEVDPPLPERLRPPGGSGWTRH